MTVNEPGKPGDVIDTATQAGANEIVDIQFLPRDQQAVHARALREAVRAAKGNAQALVGR